MNYLYWNNLSNEERIQVTDTYISIRAEEESINESLVDISGVQDCRFIRDEFDPSYFHVEI